METKLKNKRARKKTARREPLTHVVILVAFVDEIMYYFYNDVKGVASDFAYYELLQNTEAAFRHGFQDFDAKRLFGYVEYLTFTFNIDHKALKIIRSRWKKKIKHLEEIML